MRLRLRVLPAMAMIAALLMAGAVATPAHAQAAEPPAAATSIGCGVAYQIDAQWSTGFQASATVTNTGTVPVVWQVTIVFGSGTTITNGWNGVFSIGRTSVIIDPPVWAPTLDPGLSYTAGMVGTGSGVPTSVGVTCWAA